MPERLRLVRLPELLDRKIYKTGQTRGADDDVIFQNRVLRNSTVLIPYDCWKLCQKPPEGEAQYEKGYIVIILPDEYFALKDPEKELAKQGLKLGENLLVFYQTREQWGAHDPTKLKWTVATSRQNPLGGQYVARVPGITAENGERVNHGFTTTANKGAGIRVYEYASSETIKKVMLQLEALFWLCTDADAVITRYGMAAADAALRKAAKLKLAEEQGLLDFKRLAKSRIIDGAKVTICPLCLEELPAAGFFTRMEQAEGRAVPDITVTQVNLFHINELRVGSFNHLPYNVGWGHHHCNVVVKDSGIQKTMEWMQSMVERNRKAGYLVAPAAK
jgi:BstXI restriction endonuclease